MEKLGIPKETFDKSSEGFSPRYRSSSARSGGCFIATTVYNSPYAPEVQTLRHFRDRLLLTSSTGKIFVAFYYRTSPMIAKLLSKSEVMKRMVQYCLLDPLVHLLRKCK
ncbi:MAG: CFI-box-CTERM domain-containing protein [bacterium]